ncbi:MAG: hypothetical protein IPO21_11180 [Bacteroidales bacterium]|nr:hypothetical protein [Bacteroidales bacterium]
MLGKGFLVKDDPDQPVYQLPKWFDNTIAEHEIKNYWIYNFFEECEEAVHELWLTNGFFVKGNVWFEDLWIKWENQIASVFILSGNINDYTFHHMKGYMPTTDFIAEEFLNREKGTDFFITYSLSNPFCIDNRKNGIVLENISRLKDRINIHLEKRNNESELFNKLIEDFKFIDELLITESNLVISISNADLIFSNENSNIYQNLLSDYMLRWSYSTNLAHKNNAVILITVSNESINRHLISQSSKLESIHIPRPKTEEERLKFILFLQSLSKQIISKTTNTRAKNIDIPTKSEGFRTISLKDNLLRLAKQTSGLNFIGIEDLLLQIQAKRESSEEVINRVKADILQTESGGVLKLVSSIQDWDKDICGYVEIKKRLNVISEIIGSNSASRLQQRIIPMGILFVDSPGTGKQ